ncbi:MAG TPA: hypothetical protein VGW34_06705 [Allosphingosinicella sp.]|nr:hypothetical protein [Allosphingosinicella sp.]
MHEDFDTRLWADHGPKFTAAIADLFAQAGVALKRLNEIEFDAPWRRTASADERG